MADRVHPTVPPSSSSTETSSKSNVEAPHPPHPEPSKPVPPPPATYVIQLPREQIFRYPPTESTRKFRTSNLKKNRRSCCRRCCCFTLCLILLLIVAACIAAGVFYLIFRPESPRYTVDRIRMKGFNLTSTAPISPGFDVSIKANNPNDKIGIYYLKDGAASVFYNDVRLCDGVLPTFYQPKNNITVFQTTLKGSSIVLARAVKTELLNAQKMSTVPFVLRVKTPVKIKVGSIKTWEINVKVKCDVIVDALNEKAKIISKKLPPPPVLMPVPGAGPLGPFVPAPPEVAMRMLQDQGGPSLFEGSRNGRSGPQLSGPAPIIALPPSFRQDPRRLRSYNDLDAPEDEVTVIDYRSLYNLAGEQPRTDQRFAGMGVDRVQAPIRFAVVTGANNGIGLEIVRQLASAGLTVVLTARNENRGLAATSLLQESGLSNVVFHQLDVQDRESIESLANFINTQFGRLDVNNAGASGVLVDEDALRTLNIDPATWLAGNAANLVQDMIKTTYEKANECLDTNYYGVKNVTEALLPLLQLSTSGARIVNVSSLRSELRRIPNEQTRKELGDIDTLTEEKIDKILQRFLHDVKNDEIEMNGWQTMLPAYSISKSTLNAYTRVVAKKYPQMCINCVHPGHVNTDFNLHTGTMTVEEGAEAPVMSTYFALTQSKVLRYSQITPLSWFMLYL
ncbi:unnamed protein product [Fraxinus pennsylvanica]|uniref:Late embryogenesis abundant protein LEA-2 subgroup domain-containing protein n=1 Tax=Fraxinus pennsylvanica TaxID=56036 RepID=A0AAD1ZWL8_9LAMI|nr:unnamed protein product [Fraxinus pennsylvanica]